MSIVPVFKIGLGNVWLFMSVFLLQMVVMVFADRRIMEKSHVPPEARITSAERYAGILGNLVWMISLVYSIFLPLKLGSVWFYFGSTVFGIGLILLSLATVSFITTPADQVISRGIYRFSRHPMYLATFFIILGAGIASASWLLILLSLVIALCFRWEALIEERFCLKKYGDVYRVYLKQVPRWFGVRRQNDN